LLRPATQRIQIKAKALQKERSLREKKKETRKGRLDQFFSLQAALPRLFLGRILPKKAASYQNLTGSREPLKAT
jgi:hypothetical protein